MTGIAEIQQLPDALQHRLRITCPFGLHRDAVHEFARFANAFAKRPWRAVVQTGGNPGERGAATATGSRRHRLHVVARERVRRDIHHVEIEAHFIEHEFALFGAQRDRRSGSRRDIRLRFRGNDRQADENTGTEDNTQHATEYRQFSLLQEMR